jgi:hypothetical protein
VIAAAFLCLLSGERVMGLPLWFGMSFASWTSARSAQTQVYWCLGFGAILASLYAVPFAAGMILLALVLAGVQLSQRVLKQEFLRVMIAGEVLAVGMAILTGVMWTPQSFLIHGVKLAVTALVFSLFWRLSGSKGELRLSSKVLTFQK